MMKTIVENVVLKIMFVSMVISMATVFTLGILSTVTYRITPMQTMIVGIVLIAASVLMCLILGYLDTEAKKRLTEDSYTHVSHK